ncbi:MAG: TetR/AcrR family transcriptional regulator [Pseudomonadota bacterium]
MSVVSERRSKLASALIEAALARIEEDGLKSLRARDLAKDCGCSLGAIYNVFRDLDDLLFHANAQTLRDLGRALAEVSEAVPEQTPENQLIALADGYLAFCQERPRRWNALFTQRIVPGQTLPDWYKAVLVDLIARIAAPIADLFPELPPRTHRELAEGLFAAAHGVISLGLQSAFFSTDPARIRAMNAQLIRAFAASGKLPTP